MISQIVFSALGTSIVHLVSFMLAWEWFSPQRRGVVTGSVISFQQISTSFMLLLQVGVINSQEVSGVFELHTRGRLDKDVDIYSRTVANKMTLLYFVMCGIQILVTVFCLATSRRNQS